VKRWSHGAAILAVVALAPVVPACSGDDNTSDEPKKSPPASDSPSGGGGASPPSAGQLPPEFTRCMTDNGFPIESPDEIHSAPQQVLQECFGSLHGGAGRP
jgi:hypothetical protein